MKTLVSKFTLTIPETHPQAGEQVEKPFEYRQCETEAEALDVMDKRKLPLIKMVNQLLKDTARSNAYQAALLPYKPTEVSQDDIKERMIRDFIRLGFTEEVARAQVEGMLASSKPAEEQAVEENLETIETDTATE